MSTNDITGDDIRTKPATDEYHMNYDQIQWGTRYLSAASKEAIRKANKKYNKALKALASK
jgi:hypothetical protein